MPDCKPYMEPYNVGCFTHCGDINTGLIANHSGIHTIVFEFRSVVRTFETYARKGESIIIHDYFNEDSEQYFKVYEPNGHRYIFHKYWPWAAHCQDYDLFKITIKIGMTISEACNTVCCSDPLIICENTAP